MRNVKPGHDHPIVCLDAGHYGKYNRSPVLKSYYESEMAWKLTMYEKAELEKYGIEVRLTRSRQDEDLELTARGRKAKDADLFESNHSNACGDETVDRPVMICLLDDDCGAIDEQSGEIARLMGKTIRDTMGSTGDSQVISRRASRDRDGDGERNDDYYGVLYGAHQVGTPAVISEHSFHTNLRAARWLSEDANLRRLAAAKARTIAGWFGVRESVNEAARSFSKELAGTYTVTCSALNLRRGAGICANSLGADKTVLAVMPRGTKVRCYGYYTAVGSVRWMYLQYTANGVTMTGFANGKYLAEVQDP